MTNECRMVLFFAATCVSLMASAGDDAIGNVGETKLKGLLGERLDQMIERHVVGTDVDYITACFQEKTEKHGWWQTEFWGKWMHAAVPYLSYCGSEKLRASIDRGIDRMLASQEANGYIGNYPDELRCGEGWDVWGMKYTMMGLLHYYDLMEKKGGGGQRSEEVLNAAKRLCDYVIGEIGPDGRRGRELWQTGNWSGYASSSILEPVMWLHNRTKDRKYLDFATFIVKGMTEPPSGPRLLDLALKGISVADRNGHGNTPETHGGYVCKHNRWKAYEMMSCYQGLIEYARVTGRRDLLDAALATGKDIIRTEINLAGGCACSEAWFHGATKQHLPYTHLQETCVTTTWMRFCEALLDETGDPVWAEQIENTFYNAYLASLKPGGSEFASYTPLSGNRYRGHHHCFMHTNCCTANGPRGFLCFLRKLFESDGGSATFNFYASALVKGFDVYSLYPRDNYVRIVSHTTGRLEVRLRIPSWSEKTVVKLNGDELAGVKAGSYFTIARDWKLGDVIEMSFDMQVVAHTLGEIRSVPGAFAEKNAKIEDVPHYVAFTRGPVLLARDSRLGGGDMMEPFQLQSVRGRAVMTNFTPVRSPSDDIWMTFTATLPIGCHTANPEGELPEAVTFCDYASAGNTWDRDNYYRTWFPMEWGPTE